MSFDFEKWRDYRYDDCPDRSARMIADEFRLLIEAARACTATHHYRESTVGCPDCALHEALRDLGVTDD